MTTFFNRPATEQELIRKAYDFEVKAIKEDSAEPNPFRKAVLALADGIALWEGINQALEMAFN